MGIFLLIHILIVFYDGYQARRGLQLEVVLKMDVRGDRDEHAADTRLENSMEQG